VQVLVIGWHGKAHLRQLCVNQQMVVAGVGMIRTRRGNAHIAQSELHYDRVT
jgi:hypothetical protein